MWALAGGSTATNPWLYTRLQTAEGVTVADCHKDRTGGRFGRMTSLDRYGLKNKHGQ